jgi:hypothetical protein
MKRKNIYYHIIGAVCAACGLSSCSDFLDIEPQNEIILEKFWNEKADVDGIVAGCYSGMQSEGMLMRMMVWGEFRSDNIGRGQNLDKDASLESVLKENLTASNAYTSWNDFYNIINRCNTVIKYAPAVAEKDPSFTDSELKATIAEVTAIRSLCYFYLIRTFRDVPYSTTAFTDDNQVMDLPATKFEDILDMLIADLESVKNDAVQRYPSSTELKALYQTGRITQDAVYAMLCEMYLWKKDYQKCVEYADLVINSKKKQAEEESDNSGKTQSQTVNQFNGFPLLSEASLYSSTSFGYAYSSIFGTGNSSESIFELTFVDNDNMLANAAVNLCYGYASAPLAIMGFASPSTYVSQDVSSKVYKVFRNQYDTRYYENCVGEHSSSTSTFLIGKYLYKQIYINASGSAPVASYSNFYPEKKNKSNWIIYRLADIMLLKAEALTQMMSDADTEATKSQNQQLCEQAFNIVSAINKRSLCQPVLKDTLNPALFTTKSQMAELVLQERQRELMFEGKRWYDLVRWSRRAGNTRFLSTQVLQKFSTNTSVIQSKFTKMDAIYWPYNVDELKVNKNLKQNPAFGSGESGNYSKTN